MENQHILQQAKKYVAIVHGFKDWEDIDRKLNTGWTNDGEVQEAALLDEVAIRYGELLLNHITHKYFPKNQNNTTLITLLPLDEVKDVLDSFTKEVTKVAIMTGDDFGMVVEYIEDRKIHTTVIRTKPKE